MSLSDCEECWGTPCLCGWEWRTWGSSGLEELIGKFGIIMEYHKSHPNAKFSSFGSSKTEDDIAIMVLLRMDDD